MFINFGNQLINTDHIVRVSRAGDTVVMETENHSHTWKAGAAEFEALQKTLGALVPGEVQPSAKGGKR
jgi:hypothetical protein